MLELFCIFILTFTPHLFMIRFIIHYSKAEVTDSFHSNIYCHPNNFLFLLFHHIQCKDYLYPLINYCFSGKNTTILVPIPFLLNTLKYPLCPSIIHFAMDNPRPVPPSFLSLAVSALKNRSNI